MAKSVEVDDKAHNAHEVRIKELEEKFHELDKETAKIADKAHEDRIKKLEDALIGWKKVAALCGIGGGILFAYAYFALQTVNALGKEVADIDRRIIEKARLSEEIRSALKMTLQNKLSLDRDGQVVVNGDLVVRGRVDVKRLNLLDGRDTICADLAVVEIEHSGLKVENPRLALGSGEYYAKLSPGLLDLAAKGDGGATARTRLENDAIKENAYLYLGNNTHERTFSLSAGDSMKLEKKGNEKPK